MQVQKTVFICYRREVSQYHAIAVYQALSARGYDVFIDYRNIDVGLFERIIFNQIDMRAHFLVMLTPRTLDRCVNPNDWLRREIEHAIDQKRHIVLLIFEPFNIRDMQKYLTDKLAALFDYESVRIPEEYFEEAIHRLDKRFLNKQLDLTLHPTSPEDRDEVSHVQSEMNSTSVFTDEQVNAEKYLRSGIAFQQRGDLEQAISDYTQALKINSEYAEVYNHRGFAYQEQGNYDEAIGDYNAALNINPEYIMAYNNRGNVRIQLGYYDEAIADFDAALRINPRNAEVYNNRGLARNMKNDYEGTIADFDAALRINPQSALTYYNRSLIRKRKHDYDGAIADFDAAVRIDPEIVKVSRTVDPSAPVETVILIGIKQLTSINLSNRVIPYLQAIFDMEALIADLQGRSFAQPKIYSISQHSPTKLSLLGIAETIEVLREDIIPWRRNNARLLAQLEERKILAEIRETKAHIITDEERQIRIERQRLEVKQMEWELEKERIALAMQIINKYGSNLTDEECLAYIMRSRDPLLTLVQNPAEIVNSEKPLTLPR